MEKKLALTILFTGVDKLSGSLKSFVGLGKSAGQQFGQLKRQAKDLDRQLQDVRSRLASGSFQGGLVMAERELLAAIEQTNRELKKRARYLQIDNKVAKMRARGDALMASGQSNMIGGAAMLAPFVLAGKVAMDYDKQLALIAQKTDMSAAKTRLFGQAMLTAAQQAKMLPDTVIEGADFLAGKGLETSAITKMMPAIARFGTAWDVNVVDAAKAGYAGFSSLKVPVDQTARALEIMAAAGKAGGFEVKDMAKEFPLLTGQIATLGSTGLAAVADLSSALQVIEAQTGDGEQAATNLRNLFSFATSQRGIQRFKQYGVDIVAVLKKAAAEGRSPIEALIAATEKATGGDAMKIAQVVSNQDAAKAITALIQRRDQYLKIRKQAVASTGLTEKEFARMSKTSAAQWNSLVGGVQTLGIAIGSNLLPLVNDLVPKITRVVVAVGNWARENPKTARTLLTVVAGLAAARVGLGALQFAFGGILKPAATAWGVYKKWQAAESVVAAFPRAAKAFGILRTAALFMAKGVLRAGLMMLSNPMILAVVGIAAVVAFVAYEVWKHWDKVKGAFSAGVAFLSGLVGRMKSMGQALIGGLVNGIKAAPGAVWNALKSVVLGGINGIKRFLGIKSPSRLFMALGGYMTEGLALGLDQGARKPLAAMGRLATGVAAAGALSVVPAGATAPLGGVPQRIASEMSAPAPKPGQRGLNGQAAPRAGGRPIELHIHQQPGEDAEQLARRVMELLRREEQRDRRGAYRDD